MLIFPALLYTELIYSRAIYRFKMLFSVSFQCYGHSDCTVDFFSGFENILRFTYVCGQQDIFNDHNPYCYTSVISGHVLVRQAKVYLSCTIASQDKG